MPRKAYFRFTTDVDITQANTLVQFYNRVHNIETNLGRLANVKANSVTVNNNLATLDTASFSSINSLSLATIATINELQQNTENNINNLLTTSNSTINNTNSNVISAINTLATITSEELNVITTKLAADKQALNVLVGSNGALVIDYVEDVTYVYDGSNIFTGGIADSSLLTYSNNGLTVTGYNGTLRGKLIIPSGVTRIEDGAFSGRSQLTGLTLPSTVTYIGDGSFASCNLEGTLDLAGVTYLKNYAFLNNPNITVVNAANVVTMRGGVFKGCRLLTSINMPSVQTILEGETFQQSNVNVLTIPYGVTQIPDYFCDGCGNLTAITVPDTVTSIGDGSFANANKLTSIEANGVTYIKPNAFLNCTSLSSATFGDLTFVSDSAFNNTPNLLVKPTVE